jgi:hypothetical protein
MAEDKKRSAVTTQDSPGFFQSLANQIRLVLRLVADRRVNLFLKILPIGALVYTLFPDLAPGPIDDAVIIGLGVYSFIELCPPDVVEEHREAINKLMREVSEVPGDEIFDGEIVDVEFNELEDNEE